MMKYSVLLRTACAAALVAAGSGAFSPAEAQLRAALAGRVLDALSGAPVAGAVVALEPAPGGLLPDARGGVGLESARSIVTGIDGAYRFADLTPGRYRLHVQRLGYRAVTLDAEIRRPRTARVSVEMELEPVALEPVRVREQRTAPFRIAESTSAADAERIEGEKRRQEQFLTPDSRALTFADVTDGVTLGEGDLLRALQRFAGVATRDDYTAELWARGAPWGETRVTFDGLPLFNPVHAVGVLSAVTPELLGAVFFHPGVRPVSLAEGVAAVVDLRSRPGGGGGTVQGVLDASIASARVALEQRALEGDVAWLVAARRSYFDVLAHGLDWLRLGDVDLPYSFHDLAGRFDAQLSGSAGVEASGLWEEDRLFGDVEGVLERTRATWGNAAGRLTLNAQAGALATRHTLGMSRYRARIREPDAIERGEAPPWTEPETRNRVEYVRFAGELAPASSPTISPWTLGYDVVRQRNRYDGPLPRFHPVKPDTLARLERDGDHTSFGAWGELRTRVSDAVVLHPGVRVDAGPVALASPALRVAPRIAARLALGELTVSVAAGRTWQHLQAIALAGPSPHPAFHASQFWVLAGDDAPAIRSDIVTLGVERWLWGAWLASATAYGRRSDGITLPDPTPGLLLRRPLFVVGENDAHGVDVSMRRIGTTWSSTLGYSYGHSQIQTDSLRFASPADRRHVLDLLLSVRIAPSLRVAAAYTAMSGAPFTRAVSRASQEEECSLFGFGCSGVAAAIHEPYAQRTPDYHSLDASLHWTRTSGRWRFAAYAQVRNMLGIDNASTYSGTVPVVTETRAGREVSWLDQFERGLPRLPLLGVRVAF